jgi:hypothetical protein
MEIAYDIWKQVVVDFLDEVQFEVEIGVFAGFVLVVERMVEFYDDSIDVLVEVAIYLRFVFEVLDLSSDLFTSQQFIMILGYSFEQPNEPLKLAQTNQRHPQLQAIPEILIQSIIIFKLILQSLNRSLAADLLCLIVFVLIFHIFQLNNCYFNLNVVDVEVGDAVLQQFHLVLAGLEGAREVRDQLEKQDLGKGFELGEH